MPALIDAIDLKRKMFFEFERAPYHCLDVEVSRPTARGGQTLVRREDAEPAHARRSSTRPSRPATGSRSRISHRSPPRTCMPTATAFTSWIRRSFETLTLSGDTVGDDRQLLVDNVVVQVHRYNGNPIGLQFPPHVELAVTYTEPGVRGDTASGGVTKLATLETGLEIRVPLFIKEGERVKVHTETREFAGRA